MGGFVGWFRVQRIAFVGKSLLRTILYYRIINFKELTFFALYAGLESDQVRQLLWQWSPSSKRVRAVFAQEGDG